MSNTPYMNLDLPVPTTTPGPDWAEEVVAAFDVVDSHDHSPGKGTPVPAAGLNIDDDLDINNNKLENVSSVNLQSQGSAIDPANAQAVYSIAGDLWYNNNAGTPVQITQGSSIASASSPLVPSGVIWPYGGSSAPTGFLLCDGSAISRTTFSTLFAAIGTTYGVGDGSTTFNLPAAMGRTPIGAGTYTDPVSGSVTRTMGATLGAEAHTPTVGEMANHDHGGGAHTHQTVVLGTGASGLTSSNSLVQTVSGSYALQSNNTANANAGITSSNANISAQGGGNPFNIMQPSFVTNYIIKT